MNTPTPTPRTDAATYPADCLGKTLVTNRDCARALETELVTLTAAYTCTHHNDAERTACPVCLVTALTAERDELRAALALGQENCDAVYDELRGDCDELRADVVRLTAECDQLRAEAERTDAIYQRACEVEQELRAEIATEREKSERYRLVTLKLDGELAEMHKSFAGNVHTENRVLQTELATERARLDYLGKCDGAFDHIRWGDYRHYWGKGFGSLREIVDAAMKEGAT